MNEHSTVSPASLRRRGMLQTPLKLFPTDYDALETVSPPPSSGGFPAPFQNHEPPQQEPQPPLQHSSQPSRPPVLQIPTEPQPPARLSPPSNPFSSASPPGSPTIMHRNVGSQPPRDTQPLTPPQSPTTVKRSPRPAPPTSSMPSNPKRPPPKSSAEKALMQLLWVSRTIGAIVCLTFILYVVAHVRKSHSLHVILEFFVTGDVFLFTAGMAMILFSNTLLGVSASVLAFPHLGWYINFVCPFIGENYVFAYPNLAPILVGMHAHGAYVNEYIRTFLDLHYFWFLPAVLLILFANGGLTGKASVFGVLLQVVLYGVGKGVELYYPDILSHPLINFELRLVGGLVSIAVLKLISTIIYHFTVQVTNLATKKRN